MKLLKAVQKNYVQLFCIFAAFLAMVIVSYFYVSGITQEQMFIYGEEVINTSEANVKSLLSESELSLRNVAMSTERILRSESNAEARTAAVVALFTEWAERLEAHNQHFTEFLGIYGCIDGVYLDGMGWSPPDDFVPQRRPWYVGAAESADEFHYTAPYIDALTGETVMSISCKVLDQQGQMVGVVAIDVDIGRIDALVKTLQLTSGGYGILLNDSLTFVTHPDAAYIDLSLTQAGGLITDSYAEIGAMLARNEPVAAEPFSDANGVKQIAFFRKLPNGWYIGIVTPIDRYYGDVTRMAIVLSVLGFILMILLSYFLIMLSADKLRSDEENKSKTVFLAKMSHEIRTPMNAIIGMSEIALSKGPPPDISEDLISIKHAGSNLLAIVNDILDFSKMESGKFSVTPDSFRLVNLIDDVVSVMRVRFVGKQVRFVVNADAALPSVLRGDAMRIKQVLINLLGNAAKFTDEGFVALTIDGTVSDGSIAIRFEVADSGIGISAEDLKHIFGTFVQADTKRNKSVEGTGLGLPISMQIALLMNGTIDVHSEYGSGSSFTFRLPLGVVSDEPLATVKDAENVRVLLFERRTVYSDSIMHIVENLGATCVSVNSISALLERLRTERFDFIFASSFFMDLIEHAIDETEANATLVFMIKEFSEVLELPDVETIEVPVHCVSIADVLSRRSGIPAAPRRRDCPEFTAATATVLIVDDIAINLKVATGLLTRYGLTIDTCLSGADAIELVQKKDYDIVFMDHMMPEMDGLETTAEIRKLGGRYQTLPIVALTANAVVGVKEMFLAGGMDDFLAKPIEQFELARVLGKWIPKEKQHYSEIHPTAAAMQSPVVTIEGVDVPKGVHLAGGRFEDYLDNLSVFGAMSAEKLTELRICLAQNDLARLKVHVHGLKSAAANIGAAHLSRLALQIERSAAQGDTDDVRQNVGVFEQEYLRVLSAIGRAVAREAAPRSEDDAPLLLALKGALERMDALAIDRTTKDLGKLALDGARRERIKKISECILSYDYDAAIGLIGDLLEEKEGVAHGTVER